MSSPQEAAVPTSTASSTTTALQPAKTVRWRLLRPHNGQIRLRYLMRLPGAKVISVPFGRRSGKTTGAVEAMGERAIESKTRIGWFAPVTRQMRAAWEHSKICIPEAAVARRSESEKWIKFVNGTVWQFGSLDEADNALGWGYRWIVIDEAARVSKYARDEILLPMAADYNGTIISITTPKGRKGKGGHVFRDYQYAKAHKPGYFCTSGPTFENPLPSIRAWCDWAKDNMPRDIYRQEILADFLEHGAGILDLTPICVNGGSELAPVPYPYQEDPEGETSFSIGVDLAKTEDYTVIAAIGRESRRLRYFDRFHRIGWDVQIAKIAHVLETYPGVVYVDATGLGEPVVERMEQAGLPVEPVKFNNDSKTGLVQGLQVSVEREEWSMPYIEVAVSEADTLECEVISGGRLRYQATEGFHDDTIISLGLAVAGLEPGGSSRVI